MGKKIPYDRFCRVLRMDKEIKYRKYCKNNKSIENNLEKQLKRFKSTLNKAHSNCEDKSK